jgi:16S rRNA (uracil1498-N3)-methyltransferase
VDGVRPAREPGSDAAGDRGLSSVNLLVSPAELAADSVRIAGDRYRHLFRARRLPVGAELRLVDGEGRARAAVVATVDRHGAELQLGPVVPSPEPARDVTLLVAPPRPERAAWLVEKATELGVHAVRFVAAERAVRGVGVADLRRLGRVAASALEQCGGARLPALSGPHPLGEVAQLAGGGVAYLDPASAQPLAAVAAEVTAVLVGPEGGWSPSELAGFAASGLRGATLGERVLRVETAAVVAAGLLLLAVPRSA